MSEFTKKQLKRLQVIGLVLAASGLVTTLLTMGETDEETFRTMYRVGFLVTGAIIAAAGIILAGLAAVKQYTDFFDTGKRIDPDRFMYQIIGIVAGAIILIAVLVSRIEETPPDKLPTETKARIVVKEQDRNFKLMVSAFIIVSAASLLYFPSRRFLRH